MLWKSSGALFLTRRCYRGVGEEVTQVAQTEAELAAHALDAMGDEATTEYDEFADFGIAAAPSRAPNIVALVGGGLGLVVLVALVLSVLNVSHDSEHPAVEVKAPSASAAPPRPVIVAPTPTPTPEPAPAPPVVAAAPSEMPTPVAIPPGPPTAQMMAPRAPVTAETMRPPPPPPAPMFPRLHDLFPRLFP
ncbi:hypothetical protein DVS77_07270 [Mycolicibacterium moriokaense]|nr:hypothetical protein DVS77_07270 [Mycolicibacterium moriokaense]